MLSMPNSVGGSLRSVESLNELQRASSFASFIHDFGLVENDEEDSTDGVEHWLEFFGFSFY